MPSSPVIPHQDPTLLFTNAGMNQFKDVFLGKSPPLHPRATSSQKCIRGGGKHNDLDNVGHTKRHLTFFEMMGNFSFGDYFKKEAIQFAWEVSLEVFGFDPQFLWASVYIQDDEAFDLWRHYLPAERIVRMGDKDNFWAMGETGPCGPCSELYYDKGASYGDGTSPAQDPTGDRFLEFWNLVFMQYNRSADGSLIALPQQSVDTGAGLERVLSLIMGVDSVFATDVLRSLIGKIEAITHIPYRGEPAFHVLADHIRSLSFAIADGATPSNVDRGYVLRKILRRAVRYGRNFDLQRPFLAELVPTLVESMGDAFPELRASASKIQELLTQEEESFLKTLKRGGDLMQQVMQASRDRCCISGADAFRLKDTYGLPLEEILLLAKDAHLEVDLDQFTSLEEEARIRSRGTKSSFVSADSSNNYQPFYEQHGPSTFLGYTTTQCERSKVIGLFLNGQEVPHLHTGDEGVVVLDRSPFYAERGGQVGDHGILSGPTEQFLVTDCRYLVGQAIGHMGKVTQGSLYLGQEIDASVNSARRDETAHHHSATHLVHWALGELLGSHVKQAGSVVECDGFRFDFYHHKPLTKGEMEAVEDLVNQKIREDIPVIIQEMDYQEVQNCTHIKQLFGEKYGAAVRVVSMGPSQELCGGIHVCRTGQIGYFRLIKEGSVAAGIRRIEGCTGATAEQWVRNKERVIEEVGGLLGAPKGSEVSKLQEILASHQQLCKELKQEKAQKLRQHVEGWKTAIHVNGSLRWLVQRTHIAQDELKEGCDILQPFCDLIVLLNESSPQGHFMIRLSRHGVELGLSAQEIATRLHPILGSKGGGKQESAQGGGVLVDHIQSAIDMLVSWIPSQIS